MAKFEEKTFESYFNIELNRRASIYFPFGQVQEGGIGADAAAMSGSRRIWRLLGYPYFFSMPFDGIFLREVADDIERSLDMHVKNIPDMKVNLLFQYKRPERITTSRGREWKHWNKSYFRYDIYQKQQALLEHIAQKFGNHVLVLYAAPALYDINELMEAKRQNVIIERTNFRPAADLNNHDRNTYVQAGTHSVACSEPEQLKPFDLLDTLKKIENIKEGNNRSFIKTFSGEVKTMISEDSELGRAFQEDMAEYREAGLDRYPLLFSMLTMKTFSLLSGVQWIVATDPYQGD